jgi:DNA polymerase zeta
VHQVENGSFGYLIKRAAVLQRQGVLALPAADIESAMSRLAERDNKVPRGGGGGGGGPKSAQAQKGEQYLANHASGIQVLGRNAMNLWRVLRGEVKLNVYSSENVALNVLQRHLPHFPPADLTAWFDGGGRLSWRVLEYFATRARLNLQLIDQLDIIGRTSELARVFGIDFFSVLWRGSQYRVESMMLRLAARHDPPYISVSPSKHQVAGQNAIEIIPLVCEPESRLYTSPVAVLDFRSLYPSVIIAHNICYSTCLGKITRDGSTARRRLGAFDDYSLPFGALGALADQLELSPNEVMFARKEVRQGILPRMLTEILEARMKVKKEMKQAAADPVLYRILNAKQFALKLIANVTYGYTSASFSGRMPCSDIADAIVGYGREALERAIRQVETNDDGRHPHWNGVVRYGDTDSLFVEFPGRSRQQAFVLGEEIARAVTRVCRRPIELELEKVYQPCVLLTKKRYVGYSYESPGQAEPTFDAKGIETIRRDTCPVVAKMEEQCLRLLFETKDLSRVKRYCQRQWSKLLLGRLSLQDLVFRKEVKLGHYRSETSMPPAAVVATKAMALDPMAEPRYGERVPFVVVYGPPNSRLIDQVVSPHEVAYDPELRVNAHYYISKQIVPALSRIFQLVGADVGSWWDSMPRQYRQPLALPGTVGLGRGGGGLRTVEHYFKAKACVLCFAGHQGRGWYCAACRADPQQLALLRLARSRAVQQRVAQLLAVCQSCCAGVVAHRDASARTVGRCDSLDCPVFYEREKALRGEAAAAALAAGDW